MARRGQELILEYLDGRYFEKVFSNYPGRFTKVYNINLYVDETSGKVFADTDLFSDINEDKSVAMNPAGIYFARLVLNLFKTTAVDSMSFEQVINSGSTQLVSRHSNVLVINDKSRKVLRFEPLAEMPYDDVVNEVITRRLRAIPRFSGYSYEEVDIHPQNPGSNIGICVAYAIKFVLNYIGNKRQVFGTEQDMLDFSRKIVETYGALDEENSDVEFGWGGGFGGAGLGLGLGLLGGVALAGALSQPRTVVVYR